jgi:hypothetical protein
LRNRHEKHWMPTLFLETLYQLRHQCLS